MARYRVPVEVRFSLVVDVQAESRAEAARRARAVVAQSRVKLRGFEDADPLPLIHVPESFASGKRP